MSRRQDKILFDLLEAKQTPEERAARKKDREIANVFRDYGVVGLPIASPVYSFGGKAVLPTAERLATFYEEDRKNRESMTSLREQVKARAAAVPEQEWSEDLRYSIGRVRAYEAQEIENRISADRKQRQFVADQTARIEIRSRNRRQRNRA